MSEVAAALRRDAPVWLAAGAGTAVLCAVFEREGGAAVTVWRQSTAYGHCWLVLPIVVWLLWERRGVLAMQPARPAPWAWLLGLPLALAWLAAELLGLMEGRQLAAVGFVLVLLLAALGWRLWWALSAGLLYLVFLVPFGAFVTPALQRFTAGFIVAGLHVLDIPVESDAFQITIPEGVFYVAEACAGLRFLIASIAFGVLYAVTMFRSPGRRAAFIAVACIVPVVANGFRGLGIVLLGHMLGSAEAGAADHLIYGWVFFSVVIMLLAVAGLPFRQAPDPQVSGTAHALLNPSTNRDGRLKGVALACVPVMLLAVAGPLLARGHATSSALPTYANPAAPPDCTRTLVRGDTVTFQCRTQSVRVTTRIFEHGTDPATVVQAGRQPAVDGLGADIDTETWGPHDAPWMLVRARDTGRIAAYAVRVDGVQGVGGLRDRMRMLRDMLGLGSQATVAQSVSLSPGGDEGVEVLKAVLTDLARPGDRRSPVVLP